MSVVDQTDICEPPLQKADSSVYLHLLCHQWQVDA